MWLKDFLDKLFGKKGAGTGGSQTAGTVGKDGKKEGKVMICVECKLQATGFLPTLTR